jgi:biotin carboxylase
MMTNRRLSVLLLGGDRYMLRACEQYEIDAVVVRGSADRDKWTMQIPPPMTALPVDDHRSAEAILMALHRAGLGERRFDAIQTTDERSLVTASVLGLLLGSRVVDSGTAVLFRDKSLQKDRVRAAGIPVARTTVIDDVYYVDDVSLDFGAAILKPIAGAGTKLTSLVRNVEELRAASRRYREQLIAPRTFVLEEYMEGEEWVADGVVWEGELQFLAMGTYADPCLSAVTERRPLTMRRFDPVTEAWVYERAEPVIRDALAALGLSAGVFHMELFHREEHGRVVFSECAARRGGALTHEEVLCKFNVDLGEAALMCAIGRQPDLNIKVRPEVVGAAYLPGRSGTLISCPSPAELMDQPNVEFARIETPFGTQLSGIVTDTSQRLGQLLLAADSVEQLATRVEELRAWFDQRLVVAGPGLTNNERRSWQRQNWPAADFRDLLYGER